MPAKPRRTQESLTEARLLEQVRLELPAGPRRRYKELIRKRRAETLTRAEHRELLRLSDQVEELGVKRLEALFELAQRRGTTLDEMRKELGFKPPHYA